MSAARELIAAIDELLAFVFRRRKDSGRDIPRSEFAHFIKLDQTVFRLAKDLDLLDCLPRQDELAAMHAQPDKRRVWFEGKTNLPGDWEDDIYMTVATPKWLQDMNALRSIAEARIQEPIFSKSPLPADPIGDRSKNTTVALSVDVPSQRATFRTAKGDESFDLPSENAARWLKVLADHPDQWIRPDAYKRHDVELDGVRPSDKLRSLKKKCPQLARLIETSQHEGMRFNPARALKSSHASRLVTNR